MEPISYRGVFTELLFLRAQRLHASRRSWILWLFPIFMAAFAMFEAPEDRFRWTVIVAFVIGCSFPPLFWAMTRMMWKRHYRRSPYLSDAVDVTLTDQGFEYRSSTATGVVPWRNLIRLREGPEMLLVYHGPNVFNVVAREFFPSEEAWSRAAEAIRGRIEAR